MIFCSIKFRKRLRLENVSRAFKQGKRKSDELSRIMSNIGGPRYIKQKLVASVSSSIMLYGAPIWCKAANVLTYVAKIRSSYRISALREACSYRTVSYDAICEISSMIPIELLAQE